MDLPSRGLRVAPRAIRRATLAVSLSLAGGAMLAWGCGRDTKQQRGASSAKPATSERVHGLTPAEYRSVVVDFGNRQLTLGQFAEELAAQSPYVRARYRQLEAKRQFLDNRVRLELFADEARRQGLDRHPDVIRRRKHLMVQQMLKQDIEATIKLKDIKDAAVESYYDEHIDEFRKPEQRRASQIVVANKDRARVLIGQLSRSPDDDAQFRAVARRESLHELTRDQEGDLRFFSRDPDEDDALSDIPDAVRKAAFALEKVGDIAAEPIESEQGFHVLRLTAIRPALERSLKDVTLVIRNKLWRQKRKAAVSELLSRLRKQAQLVENKELLVRVKLPD